MMNQRHRSTEYKSTGYFYEPSIGFFSECFAGDFRSNTEGYFQSGFFRQSLLYLALLFASTALLIAPLASAKASVDITSQNNSIQKTTMCLYDLIGKNGPMTSVMKDYKTQALNWGVHIEFKHYASDRLALEDFQSGHCDLVNLPGIRARSFNHFTGTLNAIGAIPDYQHLKLILHTLSSPKAAKFMQQDDYEIAAIVPTGALFGFVIDKEFSHPDKLSGKKITVLDNAPETQYLIEQTGLIPVPSTINNAIQKFNNHLVDMTGAPAAAFELLEMSKGLEPDGGIINWPLHQSTMQLVIRKQKLPETFGQQSRNYVQQQLEHSFELLHSFEAKIPSKYWIEVSSDIKEKWSDKHRASRIHLRNQGIYHTTALTLFRKVRCKLTPSLTECSANNKE